MGKTLLIKQEEDIADSGGFPSNDLDVDIHDEELEENEPDKPTSSDNIQDITLIDLSMDPEHFEVEELYDGLDYEEAILRANLVPYSTCHQNDLIQPHLQQPTIIENLQSSCTLSLSPNAINYQWPYNSQSHTNEQQHSPDISFIPSINHSTPSNAFLPLQHTRTPTYNTATPFHQHDTHSTAAVVEDVDIEMEGAAAEPPESDSETEAEEVDELSEDRRIILDEQQGQENQAQDLQRNIYQAAAGIQDSGLKEAQVLRVQAQEAVRETEEGVQCGVLGTALKIQVSSFLARPYSERFRVQATTRTAPVASTSTRRSRIGRHGSRGARGSAPSPAWDNAMKRAAYVGKRTAKTRTKKDSTVRKRAAAARAITAVVSGAAGPARASRLYRRERRVPVSMSMSAVRRRLLRPKVMMTPPMVRSFPGVGPSLHPGSAINSTPENTCPSSSNAQTRRVPLNIMTVLAWRTELEGLVCAASTGTSKNPSQYHRQLCEVLNQIEAHETDLDVDMLKETKLFRVLKQFRHVNNGKGPGVESLKGKVRGICQRWRSRLREEDVTAGTQ